MVVCFIGIWSADGPIFVTFLAVGSAPVFLTGSAGAGKTTTLNAAVRQLKGDVDIASIRAELMMNTVQVFTAAKDPVLISILTVLKMLSC